MRYWLVAYLLVGFKMMEKILACNYIDVYYPSKTKKLNLKLKFGMECYYVFGFYVLVFMLAL